MATRGCILDWTAVGLSPQAFLAAAAVTAFAGFVKGTVGFAMPMIMISAFSSFLTPQQALAGLILPTLVTNISQALRQGIPAAVESAVTYRRFVIATLVFLVISARFVNLIPTPVFLLILGVPITLFAGLQLAGRSLALRLEHRTRAEWILGVIGGLYGGISGIWGPPFLVYLLSVGAGREEMIRAQGVVFLLGAVALTLSHLSTGLLSGPNLMFSAALILPALAGQHLGMAVQNRLNAGQFRRWTQILLVLTGLNLVRRAMEELSGS